MCDRELILDQYDIGCENNFDYDEYLQCLEELEWVSTNCQKSIWIKNEHFSGKSEMI